MVRSAPAGVLGVACCGGAAILLAPKVEAAVNVPPMIQPPLPSQSDRSEVAVRVWILI